MGTIQGYLGGAISNTNRVSCGITMPAGQMPTKITGFTGTLYAANGLGDKKITITLCDSAGNNAYTVATLASNGNLIMVLGNNSPTYSQPAVSCPGLAGKAVYIQIRGLNNINTNSTSGKAITLQTASAYTAVTAGNVIKATDRSQTGTSTTAGNVMTDSHFSSGTKIEASTFNSQVLGI